MFWKLWNQIAVSFYLSEGLEDVKIRNTVDSIEGKRRNISKDISRHTDLVTEEREVSTEQPDKESVTFDVVSVQDGKEGWEKQVGSQGSSLIYDFFSFSEGRKKNIRMDCLSRREK